MGWRSAAGRAGGGRLMARAAKPLVMLLASAIGSVALVSMSSAPAAEALSGSDFNPAYIISDELFYDGSAMTAAQIQAFLDDSIGACQTDRCLNVATVPVANRAVEWSSGTGNLICSAITGGNLRVSELIYRAQVACGISAKVILVTLQKEQGLVTSDAPDDWQLRAAMGMGCPDTAPCDDAFAGLASQIVSGTRQLKVYKAANFARQPGTYFIQYFTNEACGGTYVDIRNYATAALYNYTPYQPNAAALANLGTTGDGCSSYGNRNFWAYYTQWFGPTTEVVCSTNPSRDITRFWNSQGGAAGPLGAPVSPGVVAGPAGTTIGSYANGLVYCTPRLGAMSVLGDLRTKYESLGGPAGSFGSPVSVQAPFSAAGLTGVIQDFQKGTIVASAATGIHGVLHGLIRDAWGARGGSGGSLGWPIGDQESVSGGYRQQFQNGLIMVPLRRAAIVVEGAVARYWATGSNSTVLGSPTSAEIALTAGGVSGSVQYFDLGMVLSSNATGTFAVFNGAIRNAWGAQDGTGGPYGWPIGDQQSSADGYRQAFQGGSIFGSGSGAGGALSGDIGTYWNAGSNASRLGFPTGAASRWTAGGTSGTLQYFERGMVLSSASTGTWSVLNGAMRDAWGARGGSGGTLGWPTGDQETVGGDVRQQFQRGSLTVGSGLGGDIAAYVASGSNASLLGPATGAVSTWTAGGVSGRLQYFQRGMVLSSTTTGTFAVLNGPIRDAWGARDGSGGPLGWPIGDQQTVGGDVRQQFQRGVLSVGSGLSGDIAAYVASGSNANLLGPASGAASEWSAGGVSGLLQYFQRGMVLSSVTTGTFAVLSGPVRDAWGAQGGSGGQLGWPIGDQSAVSGGLRQQFEHGVIFVPSGGSAVVLNGDIATYWNAASNAISLGSPTSSASDWSAGSVSGLLQYFQRGMVLSSVTTGTHAVLSGPVRDAWGAQGGSGGSLGWPTGDQESSAGGVRQQFERGVLSVSGEGVVFSLTGTYYEYWSTGSNSALLGPAIDSPVPWSAGGVTGSYQVFEKAMVMSSSATGTFAVLNGPIRTVWGREGGSGGTLGWPTADQQTVAAGIRQTFQHGAVVVPTTGEPYIEP